MAVEEKQTRNYGVTVDKDDTSSNSNFLHKFKEPAYRSRFLRWIWLSTAMFTLGIVVSQGGPTLLDLRIITDTDKETASFFFTSFYAGYLIGSFIAGAVHRKISNNIVIAVATILGGVTTVATPYCSDVILMLLVRLIVGVFLGTIDCSLNAEHMRIWGIHGQALLMCVHFSYAIGGVIGPLISAPFLTEEKDEDETTATPHLNITIYPGFNLTGNQTSSLPTTTDVHYAYLIAGIISAVTAIPFLAMLIVSKKNENVDEPTDECTQRKLPLSVLTFLSATIAVYYIMYSSVENTFNSFLETFLVDEYKKDGVTKQHAAYITTYYWAAFAVGRFSSIFTAKCLTPERVLYIQLSLMVISFTGFLVSAIYANIDAMTGFSALVGFALSSIYPTGFSFIEAEIMKVTGIISGVILVASSFGAAVIPFLISYLMEHQSNFWFCYFLLGSVVVTCLLFMFLLLFNRMYVNTKFGTFDEHRAREKQITSKIQESAL